MDRQAPKPGLAAVIFSGVIAGLAGALLVAAVNPDRDPVAAGIGMGAMVMLGNVLNAAVLRYLARRRRQGPDQ